MALTDAASAAAGMKVLRAIMVVVFGRADECIESRLVYALLVIYSQMLLSSTHAARVYQSMNTICLQRHRILVP
jgi:hypothetical protein